MLHSYIPLCTQRHHNGRTQWNTVTANNELVYGQNYWIDNLREKL